MYEHNALGYRSDLALCLTKVRSSRARCPVTALILSSGQYMYKVNKSTACTYTSLPSWKRLRVQLNPVKPILIE